MLMTGGVAAEAIASERAKETWDSLITTSLGAHEILRSKMLASFWRLRGLVGTLLVLWTIGLVAGAVHPVAYVTSLLVTAASMWLMLAFGMLASVKARDMASATNQTLWPALLMASSGALPFLLPARCSSVLLGASSAPFVSFLSLMSYRDFRNAFHYPVSPLLQWMMISTGEGPLSIAATCLVAIMLSAVGGFYLWRYTAAHFDRLIGRPFMNEGGRAK
jgi:hypothetical protein